MRGPLLFLPPAALGYGGAMPDDDDDEGGRVLPFIPEAVIELDADALRAEVEAEAAEGAALDVIDGALAELHAMRGGLERLERRLRRLRATLAPAAPVDELTRARARRALQRLRDDEDM